MRRNLCLVLIGVLCAAPSISAQTRPYWRHTTDPVPLACGPSMQHLEWQWGNGLARKESPLRALDAMAHHQGEVLERLQHGQRHNRDAKELYGACAQAHGADFLAYLALIATQVPCDNAVLGRYLAGIYARSRARIIGLHTKNGQVQQIADPVVQDREIMGLFVELLVTHRDSHTPGVLVRADPQVPTMLRACFRADPVAFFAAVQASIT